MGYIEITSWLFYLVSFIIIKDKNNDYQYVFNQLKAILFFFVMYLHYFLIAWQDEIIIILLSVIRISQYCSTQICKYLIVNNIKKYLYIKHPITFFHIIRANIKSIQYNFKISKSAQYIYCNYVCYYQFLIQFIYFHSILVVALKITFYKINAIYCFSNKFKKYNLLKKYI